jgi:hypothetical protein
MKYINFYALCLSMLTSPYLACFGSPTVPPSSDKALSCTHSDDIPQSTSFPQLDAWITSHAFLKCDDTQEAVLRASPHTQGINHTQVSYQQFIESIQHSTDHHMSLLNTTVTPQGRYTASPNRVYLQKLVIPSESTIYFFGDLHGDIASLVLSLAQLQSQGILDNNWKLKQGHYIFFGGDLVDRGTYGIEVIATLCHLKSSNADSVFLIRGNHEDCKINKRFGFFTEYTSKFQEQLQDDDALKKFEEVLQKFYASLPVALFLGIQQKNGLTSYLQLCHGGLELYDVRPLLQQKGHKLPDSSGILASHIITSLHRRNFLTSIKKGPDSSLQFDTRKGGQDLSDYLDASDLRSTSLGFMWNDFSAASQELVPTTFFQPYRGLSIGSKLAHKIFSRMETPHHRVVGIIRAHQHNASMPQLLEDENQSVYKLPWQPDTDGTQHHAITTVATYMFTPSPSFLRIDFDTPTTAADPISAWKLTNFYIPHFTTRMLAPDAVKKLAWTQKGPTPLTQWKNAFDY